MSNSVLNYQNEKADNLSFKLREFSNSSHIGDSKISPLETILECKCAETDTTHNSKAAATDRGSELLKEFDHRLKVELGQLRQRYEMILSHEQARTWCAMKEANRDRKVKMAALRSQLECRHIAGLMFVICAERNKCHRLRNNILTDFDRHVAKLEDILLNRQLMIEEMCKACKKSSEVDQEWRQRMRRLIREFQKFITYTLGTNAGESQYLLDVEKLLDCNSIKYQEVDGEPVYEEVFDYKDFIGNDCYCPNMEEVIQAMNEDIFEKWMDRAENPPAENVEQVLYGELGWTAKKPYIPEIPDISHMPESPHTSARSYMHERPERTHLEATDSSTQMIGRTSSKSIGGVLAARDSTEIMSSTKLLKKSGEHSRRSLIDAIDGSDNSIIVSADNIRLQSSSKKSSVRIDRSILKIPGGSHSADSHIHALVQNAERAMREHQIHPDGRRMSKLSSADSHIHTLMQNAERAMKEQQVDPEGPRLSKLALMHTDSLEILSQNHLHGEKMPSDDLEYNKMCPAKSCVGDIPEQPDLTAPGNYEHYRRVSLPPYLVTADEPRPNEPYETCTLELNELLRMSKDIEPLPQLSRDSFLQSGHRNAATSTEQGRPIELKDTCLCFVPEDKPKIKVLNERGDKELLDVIPESRLFDKTVEFDRFQFLGKVYTKILSDRKEKSASQSPDSMEGLLGRHPSLCELMSDI